MIPVFSHTLQQLHSSLESICSNEFDALVQNCLATLASGNKIITTGLGKNVPICEKFEGMMTSLGMDCRFMHTNSAVHGDLGAVHSGDLVIILSKSGSTAESVYLYHCLKSRNCLIWLLSFQRDSVLAQAIPNQLIITLEHEGDPWNLVPNHSSTLNLIVLQSLAMELAQKRNVPLSVFKENHPGGAIGSFLRTNQEERGDS